MAQLIINVENKSVLPSLRRVLKAIDGVSILPATNKAVRTKKKVVKEEEPCMTKAEILAGFDEACKELKLNLEGKLEFKSAEELFNEL